jgi:diguanylate cyclase (GGDEF)-like protein
MNETNKSQSTGDYASLHDLTSKVQQLELENYSLKQDNEQLRAELENLKNKLQIDSKTGVLTEDFFTEIYAQELERSILDYQQAESEQKLAMTRHILFMIDMNGLKKINDTEGYASGDEALISVARALKKAVRSGDIVVRMNKAGDEFLLVAELLPQKDSDKSAKALTTRINEVLKSESNDLSISLGWSVVEDHNSLDNAKNEAEESLKKDKQAFYQKDKKGSLIAKKLIDIS